MLSIVTRNSVNKASNLIKNHAIIEKRYHNMSNMSVYTYGLRKKKNSPDNLVALRVHHSTA